MKVTTLYKTNAAGTGQIVAKGGGKQRTLPYDHARGVRANHRTAMIALVNATGSDKTFPRTETVEVDNGRATFYVG